MSRFINFIVVSLFCTVSAIAQNSTASGPLEKEILNLSDAKWKWMSEKDVENLSNLLHDSAQFVHMGGYWGKDAELQTIKSGAIWYKKAEIHKQEISFAGSTATVYSTIHLNSEVGGKDVRFPFYVTETYVMDGGRWKLISLVFTKRPGE